jgi:hypothetical protein
MTENKLESPEDSIPIKTIVVGAIVAIKRGKVHFPRWLKTPGKKTKEDKKNGES